MECIGHCSLKCCTDILKVEWHFIICKGSPWEDEGNLMLIFWFYLNLVVIGEPTHEGEDLTIGTIVYDFINEWCRIVVFRTSLIQILKVSAHTYGTLFLVDWN